MHRLFLLLLYFLPYTLQAQNNYNNHWFFGWGHGVHFDGNTPNNFTTNAKTNSFFAAASNAQGTLQFTVQIKGGNHSPVYNLPCFYGKDGRVMPNGGIDYSFYDLTYNYPIIVPHPIDSHKYYVFTCFHKGMQYSVVDMTLNNGNGDVVVGEKMISLLPNSTIIPNKWTVVNGCQQLWIIARSPLEDAFVSFEVNRQGVNLTPKYSYTGSLPRLSYTNHMSAVHLMKASPNGKLLAVATGSGVELYDIESCSGTIKNPRLIDTITSFGVCFSPDNKLLYATQTIADSMIYQHSGVFQYDVSTPNNVNSIINSKLLVLENTFFYWPFPYDYNKSSFIGDIAQGKDGKLYILSNTDYLTLATPQPVIPGSFIPWAQTMHIIHQPNNLGLACMPERDAHYLDGNYINRAGYYLPHPIYPVPNATIDTVLGGIQSLTQCFGKPVHLNLPAGAACIIWNTGSDSLRLSVQDTGWYWAKYNLDCSIHLDSFYVTNVPLPNILEYIIACPEQAILDIEVAPHNIHQYQYDLVHTNRNDLRKVQTDSNWTWYSLLPGAYTLRVQSGHCDTSLGIFVDTFPRPTVVVTPTNDTIAYGTTIDLTASGAYLYNWFPTISLDTGTGASVRATPLQTTTYEIIGINEYGCRDTAYSQITIDHSMEFFIPNAFSPNGDGLNDEFRLEGLTYQRLTEWGIYNRYGQQVFFTTNIQDSWDGTYRGQPCDAGVYYYYLQFFRTDGRVEERRGEVHLVR